MSYEVVQVAASFCESAGQPLWSKIILPCLLSSGHSGGVCDSRTAEVLVAFFFFFLPGGQRYITLLEKGIITQDRNIFQVCKYFIWSSPFVLKLGSLQHQKHIFLIFLSYNIETNETHPLRGDFTEFHSTVFTGSTLKVTRPCNQ